MTIFNSYVCLPEGNLNTANHHGTVGAKYGCYLLNLLLVGFQVLQGSKVANIQT